MFIGNILHSSETDFLPRMGTDLHIRRCFVIHNRTQFACSAILTDMANVHADADASLTKSKSFHHRKQL